MLSRFVLVARSVNGITRQQAARCMSGHAPAHFKTDKEIAIEQKSTMNDLPVPAGSWQEYYNSRNSRWNLLLAASVVVLLGTVVALQQTGCFYLHDMPPLKKNPKGCN